MAVICVECGQQGEQELFKRYTGGAIQLMQCENCHKVIDKYVEFDAVILLLDVLLLRIQSYRHLIYNYDIFSSLLWKLSLVLVLCEAYTKLRRLGLENSNAIILQVNFHSFLVQSILEMMILFLLSYFLLWTASAFPLRFIYVFRMLVLSSYGKLSAIAAMIWTGDFYLWLPILLVIPSQFQAICALQGVSAVKVGLVVLVLNIVMHCVSLLLDKQRTAVVMHILGGL